MVLSFYHFLFCTWIFGSLKIVSKWLETLHKWTNQYSLLKKLSLDYPGHILVLFQCLLDFTYISFKGLLCGIFVHFTYHHSASKSFETFHTSPLHWVLMKKLSLGFWWYTRERSLEFTCGSNILPLSFLCLNFLKFKNSHEMAWNFAQVTESVFVVEKT